MSALQKRTAEAAAEHRFLKLKKLVDDGREREMSENEKQREEMEVQIEEIEKEIKVKEKELKELMKDVEVLKSELIEEVVRMEGGKMKKTERAMAIQKHKKMEIRKLDWETGIDERKEEIQQLAKKKQDLEEVYIINEYIKKHQEEEEEQKNEKEKRQRDHSDDNNDDREAKRQKLVSIS